MHHLIYLSRATVPFGEAQLQELLAHARRYNAQHGLTGLLLYGNEQFFQVIEGEEAVVRELYARIRQDPRHRDVTMFADKAIAARAFPEWQMAFGQLPAPQLLELTGYLQPTEVQLERDNLSQADTQLLQLLRTFVLPTA